jgi:hypothetical protein
MKGRPPSGGDVDLLDRDGAVIQRGSMKGRPRGDSGGRGPSFPTLRNTTSMKGRPNKVSDQALLHRLMKRINPEPR